MSVGVDRAQAISPGEMHRLRTDFGVSWCAVYIGGACSAGRGWTRDLVSGLSVLGFGFLPTYVGPQASDICGDSELTAARGLIDGDDAARMLAAYGFAGVHAVPCALDIEAGTFAELPGESVEYAIAWAERVSENQYAPILYGPRKMIEAMTLAQNVFAGFWLADWVTHGPSVTLTTFDAPLTEAIYGRYPLRAWQYSGQFAVAAAISPVDWSVADFPMATTVDALRLGIHTVANEIESEANEMTDQQLSEIVGAVKGAADSTMIWLARQQRGLDVITGKKLDTAAPSSDPRVEGKVTGNANG